MQYCHHYVKCTNPIKKAQTTVIRLLAHHKPLHTMRAVRAYIGTLPKCMQVFARSVRGGDSEAIEQTISNFNAQNIILCGFKIIRKVWNFQTIIYICKVFNNIYNTSENKTLDLFLPISRKINPVFPTAGFLCLP